MGVFSRRKLQKIFIITLAVSFSYFALTSFIEKSYKNFYDQEGKDVMNVGEGNEERKFKRLEDEFRSGTKVVSRENSAESHTDLKSNSSVNIQVQNRSESIYPGKRTHENETKTLIEQLQKVTERRDVSEIPRESSKIPDGRGLQVRFWRGLIAPNLKTLCDHPLFPKGPNERSVLTKLEIRRSENYFAQQVYGYLHPSISGAHKFAVASDDDSEVWLLEEGSKEGAKKICYIDDESWSRMDDFDKFPSQRSKPIYLEKDKKYFIEVLHIQRTSDDGLQVAWLQPGATNFSIIDYRSTSLVNETSSANWSVVNRVEFWSEACKGVAGHHHSMRGSPLRVERPCYINHKGLEQALPGCPYRPDYLNRGGPLPKGKWYFLRKYQVVTCCYPWIVYPRVVKIQSYGNHPLEFTEADSIVKEYMENVEKKYPGVYKLVNILKVEKKHDNGKGARYLVELNVTQENDHFAVISEYIYKNASSNRLCYPENLQWHRNASIAVIISLRNQGAWMGHFLDNLEEICTTTGEQNVSLVVFDYDSTDINVEEQLKARQLPPYTLIKQPGTYSRCHSINAAVKAIKDPHTIVFTLDLHLEIPNTIFDDVRKHCFEGRSVYTPVIARLRSGHTPLNPFGYWEQQGYGLIAMYKSDWDRIGGLDEEAFRNKWGGEDWEQMERVVGGGLEYERIRHFKMFHYQHSKKGMWTGDNDITKEGDPFST